MPTVPLEPLTEDSPSARNFRILGAVVGGLLGLVARNSDGFGFTVAGISVRFGADTITYTASALSATKAISHGLGKTPAAVFVIDKEPGSHVAAYAAYTYTSTQFTARGQLVDGTVATGNFNVTWLAVG